MCSVSCWGATDLAKWKDKLLQMDMEIERNLDDVQIQHTEAKAKDIGLVNPASGAGMLIRDNGRIEAFADYGLGFRFDPDTQSLSVFAPNLKLFYNHKSELKHEDKMTFLKDEYKDALDIIQGRE